MKPTRNFIALLYVLPIFFLNAMNVRADDLPDRLADPANTASAPLQPSSLARFFTEGEWYFSWGYNTETWAPSDIHVSQPSQGSDFTIHNVKGHDEPGWDSGIFNKGMFAPQTNMRIGRFIDDDHTLALELSLDHTKYTSTIGQTARVTGTVKNVPVNSDEVLDDNYFRYNLHNGANYLMLNIVKRLPLIGATNENMSLSALGKAGAGLVIPHSDITIMTKDNHTEVGEKKFGNYFGTKHGWWQLDGWSAGIEAGARLVLIKPVYIELTDKVAYAYLFDIPVYQGTAKQSLWMNEIMFSLGFTYDGSKKVEKK